MAHILIIDDEGDLRAMVRDTLEPEHTVIEAANGTEGVQKFAERGFDLVITDIIMPDQEGLETIIQIKAIRSDQKIIAVSGGGLERSFQYLRFAEHLGADRIIKKPFDPHTLRTVVRDCLSSQ